MAVQHNNFSKDIIPAFYASNISGGSMSTENASYLVHRKPMPSNVSFLNMNFQVTMEVQDVICMKNPHDVSSIYGEVHEFSDRVVQLQEVSLQGSTTYQRILKSRKGTLQ